MSQDTLKIVKSIIAEQLDVDENDITEETDLVKDLEADSLDLVEMVMVFEDEFGKKVPDEALKNIKTVGDIIALIESPEKTRGCFPHCIETEDNHDERYQST